VLLKSVKSWTQQQQQPTDSCKAHTHTHLDSLKRCGVLQRKRLQVIGLCQHLRMWCGACGVVTGACGVVWCKTNAYICQRVSLQCVQTPHTFNPKGSDTPPNATSKGCPQLRQLSPPPHPHPHPHTHLQHVPRDTAVHVDPPDLGPGGPLLGQELGEVGVVEACSGGEGFERVISTQRGGPFDGLSLMAWKPGSNQGRWQAGTVAPTCGKAAAAAAVVHHGYVALAPQL